MKTGLAALGAELSGLRHTYDLGRVSAVEGNMVRVAGLRGAARVGDQAILTKMNGDTLFAEVVQLHGDDISVLPDDVLDGVSIGNTVRLMPLVGIAPGPAWIGRVVDADGRPLDGQPLMRGGEMRPIKASPPPAASRRPLGARLESGLSVFNTMLPIVRGQRIGLFAGSGVGKSTLLSDLARGMAADIVVLALVGERGRELREFVEESLGAEGMQRAIVVAATSDQSPTQRRRCLWTAMTVAEYFRDQGAQVLFLADSVTRFAEAHREVAVASGEMPALRGYPASTAHTITSLCERAGPGCLNQGDITAIFTVLVAGSDLEGPIADILRGVLDGHVVMDRHIAERGRFPAIDLTKSVSRSLPSAATSEQNAIIAAIRRLIAKYEQSEMMVKAGLYKEGTDPDLDQALLIWPELERFWTTKSDSVEASFSRLSLMLRRCGASVS
ncbi:MAG: FliI/YscN family ATPase [Pseudopelagicola sp.]|nr:FliI/YscN family ATPase [Pseudopelagicola sp.]